MEFGNTVDTSARNAKDWFFLLVEASKELSLTPEEWLVVLWHYCKVKRISGRHLLLLT
jgi:hypothetical protein